MATQASSATAKALQNEVDTLRQQNNQLSTSLSNLKDDVVSLKQEVNNFRRMVTEDMRKIIDKL